MDANVPSSSLVDTSVGEVITLEGGPDLSDLLEEPGFHPIRSGTFRLEVKANGEFDLVEESEGS